MVLLLLQWLLLILLPKLPLLLLLRRPSPPNPIFILYLPVPKNDVEWVITPSGKLTVSWLKKIAEYQEEHRVKLTVAKADSNETREVEGSALGVSTGGLELGQGYELVLVDQETGESHGPLNIEACKSYFLKV